MSEARAAKYTANEIALLGRAGKAYKDPDGQNYSYPIADVEDLRNAIHAVGRAGASHGAIRRYIMARARALGTEHLIPGNWQSDGSLRARHGQMDVCAQPLGMELRTNGDGNVQFQGWATVWDYPYRVGSFDEIFRRGAFRRSLSSNPDVCLLINHSGLPLARTTSGTLRLAEDERGLRVDADLDADDPRVQEVQRGIRRADVQEMSVAFCVAGENGQIWSSDYETRELTAVNLHKGDVSVVTMGANSETSLAMRGRIFTLEQRRRVADELGARVTGGRTVVGGVRAEPPAEWVYSYMQETEACPTCEGSGQIICPACGGTGTVDNLPHAGAVGTDGLEELPVMSSAPDGQRAFVPADLNACRAEVEALREGERHKKWELEVRESHHALQVARLRSQTDFRERMRREQVMRGLL